MNPTLHKWKTRQKHFKNMFQINIVIIFNPVK